MSDVHTSHCCITHGCKYGDDGECTVVQFAQAQDHPCEMCWDPYEDEERTFLIVEGPDGCGKTEVVRALSGFYGVPRFKVSTETSNWLAGTFKESLAFDMLLPQFIEASKMKGVVFDRSYPSEWVYSQVFGRETHRTALAVTDAEFAKLGAVVVVLLRRDYTKARADELVPAQKLQELHDMYLQFAAWTKCKVVTMYVDDYGNSLQHEMPELTKMIEEVTR